MRAVGFMLLEAGEVQGRDSLKGRFLDRALKDQRDSYLHLSQVHLSQPFSSPLCPCSFCRSFARVSRCLSPSFPRRRRVTRSAAGPSHTCTRVGPSRCSQRPPRLRRPTSDPPEPRRDETAARRGKGERHDDTRRDQTRTEQTSTNKRGDPYATAGEVSVA